MAKIVIRLKSGFELPVECENFKYMLDVLNEISEVSITGAKDNRPLYLNPRDIECVWQVLDGDEFYEGDAEV